MSQGYGQGQPQRGQGDPWVPSGQGVPQWQDPRAPQPYQQYGPPPGYQPQHAPPPRRPRRHRGLKILAWASVAFLALIILVIALSPKSSTPPAATGSSSAPAASQQAAAPATTKPAAARTVATFSGSGIKNTAKFSVGATWKLSYTYDCSSFGGAGNFIVSEDGGQDFTGATVNEIGASGSSSTMAYGDAGTHYLSVDSECAWTLKVADEG